MMKPCAPYLLVALLTVPGVPPVRATAVIDYLDLPIEIVDLLNSVEQVKVVIDQLIAIMDEFDHWQWQARKLTRNGFRLRDIEQFLLQNSMGYFYGGSGLKDLASAIDGGGDPDSVAEAMLRVYPPAEPIRDWDTGTFRIDGGFIERVENLEKAAALNYTGAVEAFSNVGKARTNWFENKEVHTLTMDLFENPANGEQESLDLLNVQLGQVVDLSIQEQAMLNGFGSALASSVNHRLVQEKQSLTDTQLTLTILTEMANQAPEIRDDLSF